MNEIPQKVSESVRRRNPHLYGGDYRIWTEDEFSVLGAVYSSGRPFSLSELAARLGRSYASVACKADELGLCSSRGLHPRHETEIQKSASARKSQIAINPNFLKDEASAAMKEWHRTHNHPRGMLGKNHTQELKDRISRLHTGKKVPAMEIIKRMKTNISRYGVSVAPNANGRKASWKAQWAIVGGKKFFARSSWELNYARFLQWRLVQGEIFAWEHEPKTFWFNKIKRGCVSYKPDFEVILPDLSNEFHEVKGWMDSRSRTVLKRMRIYYPTIKVVLIDSVRYKSIMKTCGKFLPPNTIERL